MNAYTAIGHGGQYLYAVPEHNLLVVSTAYPYALQYQSNESLAAIEGLVRDIIAALK